MGFEIEAKFRIQNHSGLEGQLVCRGWSESLGSPAIEEDQYFQGIDRDFRQSGEALRVRVKNGVPSFTYKGVASLSGNGVKVRREMELEIPEANPCNAINFLEALGFQKFALVRKVRRSFSNQAGWPGFILTLDEVEKVGSFAEIEYLSHVDGPMAGKVTESINEIARQLGLGEMENRSYLRMLMEKV